MAVIFKYPCIPYPVEIIGKKLISGTNGTPRTGVAVGIGDSYRRGMKKLT
jgi:hypothetical protein